MSRYVLGATICWAWVAAGTALAQDCADRDADARATADARCSDRDDTAMGAGTGWSDRMGTADDATPVMSSTATAAPASGEPARASYGQDAATRSVDADAEKDRYGPGAPYDPYGPSPDTWRALP